MMVGYRTLTDQHRLMPIRQKRHKDRDDHDQARYVSHKAKGLGNKTGPGRWWVGKDRVQLSFAY